MKIHLSRAGIGYEVGLKTPVFKMASNNVENVQILYSLFSRFSIATKDIAVIPSQNLAEFIIKLSAFDSLWTAGFQFDKYGAQLNGLVTGAQFQLGLEFLQAVDDASHSLLPDGLEDSTRVTMDAWYSCEGGSEAVQAYFSRHAPKTLAFHPGFEGTTQIEFSINGTLQNVSDRWVARFTLEPSSTEFGDLFVQFDARYQDYGKITGLKERANHFKRIYTSVLAQAGFELSSIPTLERT